MEFATTVYLSQRISEREKLKNDKEWAKRMIDYIAMRHLINSYYETRNPDSTVTVHNDYARMLSNYQLYNNVVNQKDFERECNPLGHKLLVFFWGYSVCFLLTWESFSGVRS